MPAVPIAILWECWRRSRYRILAGVVPILASLASSPRGSDLIVQAASLQTHYTLVLLEAIAFLFVLLQAEARGQRIGFPSWSYTLPVSTSVLVGWHMAFPVLAAILLHGLATVLINGLMHTAWPLWGPALFLAAFVAVTQAIVWSLAAVPTLTLAACALAGSGLLLWFNLRYGIHGLLSAPVRMWSTLTPEELLSMASFMATAFVLAVFGVNRDRRGQSITFGSLDEWLDRLADCLPRQRHAFASPSAAHFWFEWSLKGRFIPALATICVMGLLLLSFLRVADTKDLTAILLGFTFAFIPLFAPFIAGCIAGQCGRNSKAFELDPFRATRPLTDWQLAMIPIKMGILSLLLAWLIALAGMLLLVVWLFLTGQAKPNSERIYHSLHTLWTFIRIYPPVILLPFLTGWTILGLTTSLMMTGRRWIISIFFAMFYVPNLVVSLLVKRKIIPDSTLQTFLHILPYLLAIAVIVAAIAAFIAAGRKRFLSLRALAYVAAAWLALCVTFIALAARTLHTVTELTRERPFAGAGDLPALISITPSKALFVAAFIAMALAPIATVPLALAWNRHR